MKEPPYLILFLGADWWGSDARALAVALRKQGHSLIELNYEDYLPTSWSSLPLRVVRRLIWPLCTRAFNQAIKQRVADSAVDFVLAFKGMLLQPATLKMVAAHAVPSYCFYPDVSFVDHGPDIAACLPLYDCVFTTKQFHVDDPVVRVRVRGLELVRHGFDPAVHRPVKLSPTVQKRYECDVSFVGCWSPKKEHLIAAIMSSASGVKLKVWGTGWERAGRTVAASWMGRGAFGDELAIIYRASKINLGLLSEAGGGTTMGDEVTARTWQIPASGGFLLHEETAALRQFFGPDEVATFSGASDIAARVTQYLRDPEERRRTADAGQRKCVQADYTYGAAARRICLYHAERAALLAHRRDV